MLAPYYKLPLRFGEAIHQKELAKSSLYDSVTGMIHLIAITYFGECKHDDTFGCEIWEHDFENISNNQQFREKLIRSIRATIEKHEKRLTNIQVDIQLEQIDIMVTMRRIKSRISLRVKGTLVATNEPFSHFDQFFIGPLSYY